MSNEGPKNHTLSPGAGSGTSSSLSLPTANTARRHLDSKKKSDTKQIHPGYSMFDWNKICNSGRDMTGTKGQLLRVTHEELARHCKEGDIWTAVRGVVYNVTLFAKFHPGGKAQLMRGAGEDCTEIFDKIHVWVNSEAILEKCMVGYLVGSKPPQKPTSLNVSITKPPFPGKSESGGSNSPGEDVLTLQVPGPGGLDIGNVGGSNVEGNMEEGSRLSDDSEEDDDEITIPVSISISVPSTGSISIPVPSISIQVPDIQSDVPVPSISIPVLNTSKHTRPTLPPYITDHPLISKTAYETSV